MLWKYWNGLYSGLDNYFLIDFLVAPETFWQLKRLNLPLNTTQHNTTIGKYLYFVFILLPDIKEIIPQEMEYFCVN